MKRRFFSSLVNYLAAAGMTLLLAGCGGGGGGGGSASGTNGVLSIGITDAPVDDLYQVWVAFTRVIIQPKGGGGRIVVDVTDDLGNPKMIELKSLGSGQSEMLLNEYPLPQGDYSWARLEIDPSQTYVIVNEGGQHLLLDCPSCSPDQSGLKLNRPFHMDAEGWVAFTIDFDLRKSITLRQRNKPNPRDYDYRLRPTLRILDTEIASSFLYGTVTDTRAEQANPADPSGCAVYVYEGDVEPDDICLTADVPPQDCASPGARPELEADVTLNPGTGLFEYRTGFIYPGIHTVALVCENDAPARDQDLTFYDVASVDAIAGANGTRYDFELADLSELTLDKRITSGNPYAAVGDMISYEYQLTNTGNVSLAGPVSIDDDKTPVDCPLITTVGNLDDLLNPGESVTCTAEYSVSVDDVTAGSVTNTATASAGGVISNQDQETATMTP
jgi:hypothetical protein